ncbi:MAG TPA: RDD family protein [Actinoplanes sp.]|nr:RDD family protein [Actinoplanes sp.]
MTYPPQENPYGAQGYGAQGYGAPAPVLASWGQRVGANLIDGLPTVAIILVAVIISVALGTSTDPATGVQTPSAASGLVLVLGYVLGFLVYGYNRWYLAGKTGQSWGKKVLGLKLIKEATGQPIGFGLAFARDIVHNIIDGICLIGYLFPLWDAKKQTIADKLLSTLVVK